MNSIAATLRELPAVLREKEKRDFVRKILASPGQRRHLLRWIRSMSPDFLFDEPSPWITCDAYDYLRKRLPQGARVFEYGSGGSTLFWKHRGAALVSVEHDREWYETVRRRLGNSPGVDYRLVPPEQRAGGGNGADPSEPRDYASDDTRYAGLSFRNYVSQIDAFPDASFDVLLIDGRARPSCIMHGGGKVRIGGFLVLDNADRSYYTEKVRAYLENYERRRFFGVLPSIPYFSATDVYVRMR